MAAKIMPAFIMNDHRDKLFPDSSSNHSLWMQNKMCDLMNVIISFNGKWTCIIWVYNVPINVFPQSVCVCGGGITPGN